MLFVVAVLNVDVASNFRFIYNGTSDGVIRAALGDIVRFTWTSNFHSVTSGNIESCVADGKFNSGTKNIGHVYELALTPANGFAYGAYPYYCAPHCSFGMTGVIHVGPSCTPASSAVAHVVRWNNTDCSDADGGPYLGAFYSPENRCQKAVSFSGVVNRTAWSLATASCDVTNMRVCSFVTVWFNDPGAVTCSDFGTTNFSPVEPDTDYVLPGKCYSPTASGQSFRMYCGYSDVPLVYRGLFPAPTATTTGTTTTSRASTTTTRATTASTTTAATTSTTTTRTTIAATTTPASRCGPADFTKDDAVNLLDVVDLLDHWGVCAAAACQPFDLNSDATVNAADLAIVLASWCRLAA